MQRLAPSRLAASLSTLFSDFVRQVDSLFTPRVNKAFGGKRHEMVGTGNRLSMKQIGFLIYA